MALFSPFLLFKSASLVALTLPDLGETGPPFSLPLLLLLLLFFSDAAFLTDSSLSVLYLSNFHSLSFAFHVRVLNASLAIYVA